MPHFSDGTEAHVGDVVRGKGYNIKDEQGELKEIVGTLIHITPHASSCNVQIAVTEIDDLAHGLSYHTLGKLQVNGVKLVTDNEGVTRIVTTRIEYGQADHFEKIL